MDSKNIIKRARLIDALEKRRKKNKDKNYNKIPIVSRTPKYFRTYDMQIPFLLGDFGNKVNNVIQEWKIKGDLNIPVFEKSINKIIERHESLRTSFDIIDEIPVQCINSKFKVNLNVVDLSDKDNNTKNRLAFEAKKNCTEHRFKFGDCLVNVLLVKMDNEKFDFLFVTHHIVCDAWAISIFCKELSKIYNSLLANKEPELSQLTIQSLDYLIWKNSDHKIDQENIKMNYWNQKLGEAFDSTELLLDFKRKSIPSNEGETYFFEMDKASFDNIKSLVKKYNFTNSVICLAAFLTVIYKFTNSSKISIGTITANREELLIDNLIGNFFNVLIISQRCNDNMSFIELVEDVNKTAIEAVENEVSFINLISSLKLQPPPVKILFNYINCFDNNLNLSNTSTEKGQDYTLGSFNDILFYLLENENTLTCYLRYDIDLYKESTIKKIVQSYLDLLKQIINNENIKIKDIVC